MTTESLDGLPAIDGGTPAFDEFLVFGKPVLGEEEVEAVASVIRSTWIGQGDRCQEFEEALLGQPEERSLAKSLADVGETVGRTLGREEFDGAMSTLASLRRPVDEFFDNVTVNAGDAKLRANRLRLLSRIRNTMNQVADFSQIEG